MPSVITGIETSTASVVVGRAEATTDKIDVGAAIIEDTTEETSDTIPDTSESTIGGIKVGAEVGAVVTAESAAAESSAAESAATGDELVAAAAKAVMTPFGPNVMGVSEDVVAAAAPEVSSVLGVVVAAD
jgi:hypothetical protein